MAQETVETTNLFLTEEGGEHAEGEYVPDVYCPNPKCGREKRLRGGDSYGFYDGNIICEHCHSTFYVRIGDVRKGGWAEYKNSERYLLQNGQSAVGGELLEGPTLVSEGSFVPDGVTEGLTNVPLDIGEAFDNALQNFNDTAIQDYDGGDYGAVAARCRFILESALLERGINKSTLRNMADDARSQGLISDFVKNICYIIASRGGDGAHPQTDPFRRITRWDALSSIGETAGALRILYPANSPSP